MENTNTKINKGMSDKIQIAILILTIIAVCCFIVAIIVLVNNIDEIKQNPIDYGIDKYELDSCTCVYNGINYQDFYGSNKKEEVIKDWTS